MLAQNGMGCLSKGYGFIITSPDGVAHIYDENAKSFRLQDWTSLDHTVIKRGTAEILFNCEETVLLYRALRQIMVEAELPTD